MMLFWLVIQGDTQSGLIHVIIILHIRNVLSRIIS
jgi:hypothetical protein